MNEGDLMKRTVLSFFAIISLILAGSFTILGQSENCNDQPQFESMAQPLPGGNGFMQQLRNRLCDTLGVCQGDWNLTTITGVLTYDGTNFYVDSVEVHFGPIWYITSAESAVDYDGDGTPEIIFDELQGLTGSSITIEGHMQSDNWMSVFTINGETYRELGQPIWASQHQWQWRKGNGNGPNIP